MDRKRWESEECVKGQLRSALNTIEAMGGTVFQLIDSTRSDHVLIVWHRPIGTSLMKGPHASTTSAP